MKETLKIEALSWTHQEISFSAVSGSKNQIHPETVCGTPDATQ
jgi:hypothetical protein